MHDNFVNFKLNSFIATSNRTLRWRRETLEKPPKQKNNNDNKNTLKYCFKKYNFILKNNSIFMQPLYFHTKY